MSVAQTELRRKQMEQAEELLFSGPQKAGFAKDLFFGQFRSESIFPYPSLPPELERQTQESVNEVRQFCRDHIDAPRIDRESRIPDEVVLGLGRIGVLGMCVPTEHGGRGFSQQQYCRVMEVLGAHCGGTTVFVNAHHSIGLRAIEMFGTKEQKEHWLRAHRDRSRFGRFERPHDGDSHLRRARIHAQRRQAVHHQWRHFRHAHRDGSHPRC
jgi:acyl-CoA dehydrogenase family protein 9